MPALPAEWPSGRLNGVCVRGGFCLDMIWDQCGSGGIEITITIARKSAAASPGECWLGTDNVLSATLLGEDGDAPEVLCTTGDRVQVLPPCKVVVLKRT